MKWWVCHRQTQYRRQIPAVGRWARTLGWRTFEFNALKGNAKESRRISGTARDVLKAAQRELQLERSLDPGE
jgi:hypothetical protein